MLLKEDYSDIGVDFGLYAQMEWDVPYLCLEFEIANQNKLHEDETGFCLI